MLRYGTALVLALALVASACGRSSAPPETQPDDSGRIDCAGFYLGTFSGDRVGPLALGLRDDGSLTAAFVGPASLGVELTDLGSVRRLVDQIGLVLGEDITVSTSGIEIAPGALAVDVDGVRLGTIEITLDPAGSVTAGGAVQPAGTPELSGDFQWDTCTGSGEWADGDASGRWQVAVRADGLSADDCDGPIFIGIAPDFREFEIDLDVFCLSKEVDKLPKKPGGDGIKVGNDDKISVYTLETTVLFEFGEDVLTSTASAALDTVVAAINETDVANPTIRVIGHTDSIGSSESNLALSQRRAEAVREDLAARLPAATITAFGLGEFSPTAPNANPDGTDNPEGRRQNRRVDIIVTG